MNATRSQTLSTLEHEVGVVIRRVKRVIGERARAVHEDLQPGSYLVLTYLESTGSCRSTAIAGAFDMDKGAVSRQVQHLTELGLIERTPDPADGRAALLAVTDDAAPADGRRTTAPAQVPRRTARRLVRRGPPRLRRHARPLQHVPRPKGGGGRGGGVAAGGTAPALSGGALGAVEPGPLATRSSPAGSGTGVVPQFEDRDAGRRRRTARRLGGGQVVGRPLPSPPRSRRAASAAR